jgi:hypothetical protein
MQRSTTIKLCTSVSAALLGAALTVAAAAAGTVDSDCVHARCDGTKSCARLKSACQSVLGKWGCRTRDEHGHCIGGDCKKCYD